MTIAKDAPKGMAFDRDLLMSDVIELRKKARAMGISGCELMRRGELMRVIQKKRLQRRLSIPLSRAN